MRVIAVCVVAVCGLALAGCAKKSDSGAGALSAASATATPTTAATSPSPATTKPASTSTTKAGVPAAGWPSSEDCVTYNPATLTVAYASGTYRVTDGSHEVLTVDGQPGDVVGQQALAVAARYKKHCYIGRDNARADQNAYIFDYWRMASGQSPVIPGLDGLCSDYNKHNLTVEDMGGGDGWRVKDHDHVLHLFDNSADAHNGAMVLAKYGTACSVGGGGDNDPRQISFFLP
jgi:hypothetical protein